MFARTQRLTLRPGWPEDAPALTAAIAHESVATRLARLPWPYTLAHAEAWLGTAPAARHHAMLVFAHDRGDAPELVGGAGLHPTDEGLEIAYWLTPDAWGRGYATEAGHAVVQIARHALGQHRVHAYHHVDNHASGKVLRKLGFERTGEARHHSLARGEEVDCVTYALAF